MSGPSLDRSLRLTLHFHPDLLVGSRPLLEQVAADGVYQSQFETLTSNGGLTAEHLPLITLADADQRARLDEYIDAQVQGPLSLGQDVEAVILNPAPP